MVDMTTYKKMHPTSFESQRSLPDDLGPTVMNQSEPPSGEFLMLLPATVFGFNMVEKKWGTSEIKNFFADQ